MYSFLLRLKRKIKKIFRVHSDTRQKQVPSVRSRIRKVLILILASILIALVFPGQNLYNPLDLPRKGDISPRDIIAPFQITVFKSAHELEEERRARRLSVPFVLNYDTTVVQTAFTSLREFVELADSLRQVMMRRPGIDSSSLFIEMTTQFPLLGETAIWKSLDPEENLPLLERRLERIYNEEIFNVGVTQDLNQIPENGSPMVLVRRGSSENVFQRDRVLDLTSANTRLLTALNRLSASDTFDVEYHYLVGRHFIAPNLTPDIAEYSRRVTEQEILVSASKEVVNTGDIIVRSGRKVDAQAELVLEEMARILHSNASEQGFWYGILPVLIRVALVILIFSILYLFLYFFRRDIWRSNPRLVALFMVFVLQLTLIYALQVFNQSIYLYPVAVFPVMVTILFDAEIGILATIILSLLLGVMNRFDFSLVLMTVTVGTVASLTSREVRKRSHFYRIMVSVIVAYAILIFIVENLKLSSAGEVGVLMLYGMLNGMISCLLVIGLLPFFESIFSITTDITLLELSDLNHPVLKRLALEAPGTYHHSISVGNLAEAAAEAINANPLLARVGAYYHDIGKVEVPEYFIENQLGVHSRHEGLSPTMSSLVLAAHVKRGRAIGEEAGIPDDVLNFIEEHHGTMVMTYFYSKAKEQSEEEIDIDKFKYPGPKPQVRETGIMMLADAVEAASRTLDEPKPARIYALIQRIINDRFQSGELDQCPLTLRDLAKIREAFAQILIGAFHRRVDYPRKD